MPCCKIFQGMALAWQEHGGGLILALQLLFGIIVVVKLSTSDPYDQGIQYRFRCGSLSRSKMSK